MMSHAGRADEVMGINSHQSDQSVEMQSLSPVSSGVSSGPATAASAPVSNSSALALALPQLPVTTHDPAASPANVSTKPEPHSRRFILLSILALVTIIFNFVQVGLLAHIAKATWINLPPAILFAFAVVLIGLYLTDSNRRLRARLSWNDAPYQNRLARVGAILTIILVIVICQFIYMNVTAIPQWHSKSWTTELLYEQNKKVPALLIYNFNNSDPLIDLSGSADCYEQTNLTTDATDCNTAMHYNTSTTVEDRNVQIHLFAPKNVSVSDVGNVQIIYNITWDSSMSIVEPYLVYVFLDPHLVESGAISADLLRSILNFKCQYAYTFHYIPIVGSKVFKVSRTDVHDEASVLNDFEDCHDHGLPSERFSVYDSASIANLAFNEEANSAGCDRASSNGSGVYPCISNNIIILDSQVRKLTSHRGTSVAKIIVDESGIAGGVMFFTWFLGLYVL